MKERIVNPTLPYSHAQLLRDILRLKNAYPALVTHKEDAGLSVEGRALPVVALGSESSLSAHEAAEWGIHGILVVRDSRDALVEGGRRVARTWART